MNNIAIWLCLLISSAVQASPEAKTSPNTSWPGVTSQQDATALFTDDGFRMARYRSPTPDHHQQAVTLSTQDLIDLLHTHPNMPLLDVRPADVINGQFVLTKPHTSIEGSLWTPNVGEGVLDAATTRYFKAILAKVSHNRYDAPIVMYCKADCWMSWNAVKRASDWGYTQLYWYKNGVDGWQEANRPLVDIQPVPMENN